MDLLAIDSQTLKNVVHFYRNTMKSLCFREVPVVALSHTYTEINEVTRLADMWQNWV